tara:strand:+ start:951 stop:1133 length:183 start_codon:yes stop_codon:yes gene_type:complete
MKKKKKNNKWEEEWFGDWLDIDIITSDNNAIRIKNNKEINQKTLDYKDNNKYNKYYKDNE